jgi:hypothetical protein
MANDLVSNLNGKGVAVTLISCPVATVEFNDAAEAKLKE